MSNRRGHRVCGYVIARSLVPRSSSPKIPPISKEGACPSSKNSNAVAPTKPATGIRIYALGKILRFIMIYMNNAPITAYNAVDEPPPALPKPPGVVSQ